MLDKISSYFKTNWKDYKYHSLMMDPYFSKTKRWEQFLGLFIILCLFCGYYYELKILLPIGFGILTLGTGVQTYRGFKEFNNCYKSYIKPNILKGGSPILLLKRSGGTLVAAAFKFGKPAIKACMYCISGTVTSVALFDYYYGFSPLRELALANNDLQTYDQAWEHVTNASKYAGLEHPPYVEDLKQEIIQLKKTLENINKK